MSAARTFRKIIAIKYSTNFRDATRIVTTTLPETLKPTEVLVQNRFVGINASDINFTAGIYQPDVRPPFDCGFEALGEVVEVGAGVKDVRPGDAVVTQSYGAFAEYQVVPRRHAKKVPSLRREWLPLDLSGTTASVALAEVLKPQRGERAVVTAAAGGTGHFAVQLLKHVYGCSVVGTCSSDSKVEALTRELGCDGAINYTDTSCTVTEAIRRFYPSGANIAYESVGGDLFDHVVDSLAVKGRVLSIGSISSYERGSVDEAETTATSSQQQSGQSTKGGKKPLQLRLLSKSATLHTFFLPHFAKYSGKHFDQLCKLMEAGTIHSHIDATLTEGGLEAVYAGVDLMYSRKNNGKIVIRL